MWGVHGLRSNFSTLFTDEEGSQSAIGLFSAIFDFRTVQLRLFAIKWRKT